MKTLASCVQRVKDLKATLSKRRDAIKRGALQVSSRDLVSLRRSKSQS